VHPQALRFYADMLANLEPRAVVEFGSCNMNGSVRDVYPQALSWHGIDQQPGPGVDEIADAATWQTDETFGLVICAEVFEHTPDWPRIIDTAFTVLEHGGLFLASCATGFRPPHSAVDGGALRPGEYYANVDPDEMWAVLDKYAWTDGQIIEADGHFGGDDLYVRAVK
jgi:SAM-dependent methyltransferase